MKEKMETIAIIPARGGSKGIPGKNILSIAGKPLIAHTIITSLASRLISRTVVSTDDTRIANIAEKFGAETIIRPVDISGDDSPSELSLLHVLDHLGRTENYHSDLIVFLQCTSPLTLSEDIDGTIEALLNHEADTALSVRPFHYFLWLTGPDGNAIGINHDKNVRQTRQARQPQYLENGAIYVMRTEGFKKNKHRFFGKTVMYEMPAERCFEIDDPFDLSVAEFLMIKDKTMRALIHLPEKIDALILDFDGVFTDNRVIVDQYGHEAALCNRADGMGISRLKELGFRILVLSTEKNPIVQARCQKLGIQCINNVQNKIATLKNWTKTNGLDLRNVVYVGNDINDLDCLGAAGCGVAVNDAHPQVKRVANIVLSKPGGHGAIRELSEMIEKNRRK
jgi:YrbI family 3-deoxy-D-manno-octulosonate 8-phosphate phosphatase